MSKNEQRVRALYERLEPRERARLAVEAMSRRDEDSLRMIVQTCPRADYSMTDAEYMDAVEACRISVFLAAVDLGRRLGKLDVCAAWRGHSAWAVGRMTDNAAEAYYRGFKAGSEEAWKAAGRRGKPKVEGLDLDAVYEWLSEESATPVELIRKIETTLASECKAFLQGLDCVLREELGVDAETALRAWAAPLLEDMERNREVLDAAEANPEEVQEYGDALRTLWST